MDSYAVARTLLREAYVAVAPGETFGLSSRGYVRISLAAADDRLVEGIKRLGGFMDKALATRY